MGNLINKEEFDRLMQSSSMMQWAAKELDLAGYKAGGEDNPNTWMREQVLESLAVFVSHGNSGGSAPFEINLVKQLSSWKPISKLRFTEDEWNDCDTGGLKQNNRCSSFFKNPDGTIDWIDAVASRVVKQIEFETKEDRNAFHSVIETYAKKYDENKDDMTGLIYGAWWQPLYSTTASTMNEEEYKEIKDYIITHDNYSIHTFCLLEDETKVEKNLKQALKEEIKKEENELQLESKTRYVNNAFYRYLQGDYQ